MGFLKNLITLTITETACNAINSKTKKKKDKEKEKNLEKLEKLKQLYDIGTITEKEGEMKI